MAGDTVELIKQKLNILEVVKPYVKLTKAGKDWRGLSPFNKEKTPSFFVSPDRGTFFCFSSGQGGDMFTFVQKMEGVDFTGSLKILAEKAGIEITRERTVDRSRLDKLREALARAEQLFVEALEPTGEAYKYALSRGLTPESIKTWNIGLAPDAWRTVLERLNAEGFSVAELAAAGLIKEADGKSGTWYDRFRNRLMFPIKDPAGRTVAFTGRALSPDEQAKYLNSPETELYKKHEVLFGMEKAKDAIRTRGFAVLVEGQMDLLMLHQIGFQNTIALSGTALSKEHLTLIKRYADNLMLALDADRAGLAASMKNAIAALRSGMRVKAVRMPEGKDPADLASEDPEGFKKRVAEAEPVVEFFLSVLAASETDPHRLILAAERTVLPLIQAFQSPMEQEHFIAVTARSLGIAPDAVRASLSRLPREGNLDSGPVFQAPREVPVAPKLTQGAERYGLLLQAVVANYPDTELAEMLKSEYSRIIGAAFPDDPIPERIVFESGQAFGEDPGLHAADDLIRSFEKAVLGERLAEATMRLRMAETSKDTDAIIQAADDCRDLAKRFASFS